ncbi:MAG TPA: zinc ribbon domain-containing protein [Thermodesulfobacteriota bacterium]|jgi:hypothetical protein|nr:zinc ribbon domain-containing protein [Thermodesulfobacteriota bacterium]
MTNPIFIQVQNWDNISSVCLQHLSHLPIFLFIVLVAAFVFLPFLLYGSSYMIYRINRAVMSKSKEGFGCYHCGESVRVEWDFCPKCGAEVYLPAYPVSSSEVMIEDVPHKPELPMPAPNFIQLVRPEKAIVSNDKN